jgi:hypothetical protein
VGAIGPVITIMRKTYYRYDLGVLVFLSVCVGLEKADHGRPQSPPIASVLNLRLVHIREDPQPSGFAPTHIPSRVWERLGNKESCFH